MSKKATTKKTNHKDPMAEMSKNESAKQTSQESDTGKKVPVVHNVFQYMEAHLQPLMLDYTSLPGNADDLDGIVSDPDLTFPSKTGNCSFTPFGVLEDTDMNKGDYLMTANVAKSLEEVKEFLEELDTMKKDYCRIQRKLRKAIKDATAERQEKHNDWYVRMKQARKAYFDKNRRILDQYLIPKSD